jgi:hypothetical protein
MELGITANFWNSIASTLNLITICAVLYFGSKAYKNIMTAHKRPIYNNTEVKYNNCTIQPEKMDNHYD